MSENQHESNALPISSQAMRRRSFLSSSARATAGLGAAIAAPSTLFSANPNETVRVAVIGVRGRGRNHASGFPALKDVEVAAVCDVDTEIRERVSGEVAALQAQPPKTVEDFRTILDDKTIDALVIATPDHWHGPATIWGCQAGKDVYVEKPCAHNFREARLMVEAARKYRRVVQHGTQSRSALHVQDAIEFLRSGKLGRILQAKAINSQRRANIGHKQDAPVPDGVNYDLWLGPAPSRPFNANRYHYNWHWHWDYGTGDLGNDGVHQVDIARWGLGEPAFPKSINCGGGKLYFDDDQETPDTQTVYYDYGDKSLVYEMRIWAEYREHGVDNGNVFYGEEGYMVLHRTRTWQVYWNNGEKGPSGVPRNNRGLEHRQNFVDCVRSRKQPIVDIEKGFHSSALAHFGNIAYRLKRHLHFDGTSMKFDGDPEANRMLGREYRKGFEVSSTV